ncbi:MAG: hypothetical protein LBR53_10065 [Deltaproteobacteria bacterium]|jgi:hypothetical protein|nr:hypothetical protein [Deltaproteobacteria bacterium]
MPKTASVILALLFVLLLPQSAPALPAEDVGAPPDLARWEKWLLYDDESRGCPLWNGQSFQHACVLFQTLELDLTDQGGTFVGVWRVWGEREVALPGNLEYWPRGVQGGRDGNLRPLPVAGESRPQVELEDGLWTVKGGWEWRALPETINVPLGPMLKITVNGKPLDFPQMDVSFAEGVAGIWLQSSAPAPAATAPAGGTAVENKMSVRVNRLVTDDQPMNLVTRLRLSVSGEPREELVSDPLFSGSLPIRLSSPIPARLTKEGLRVQVQQGVFDIEIESLEPGENVSLGPVTGLFGEEFWAFRQRPELRQAEVSGAPQVDPSQADIFWKSFPVYALAEGMSLEFRTLRRGDPDPGPNQLNLQRECWLDFSGAGLTCRDRLSGVMRRDWYLALDKPPFDLGQVSVNGEPRVITLQRNSLGKEVPGVQLRSGGVNLAADLRLEDFSGVLPASGWDQNLQSSDAALNLPPGFSVLYVKGAVAESNYLPAAFLDRWTTLDLFIVLVVAISSGKLLGKKWGALAAAALLLSYHEYMCPRLVYLHILVALALLRVLPPTGKARFLTTLWKRAASLVLIIFSVVFVVYQARIAVYPQLERRHESGFGYPVSRAFYRPQLELGQSAAGTYASDSFGEKDFDSQVFYEAEAPAPIRDDVEYALEDAGPNARPSPKTAAEPPRSRARAAGGNSSLKEKGQMNSMFTQATDAKVQNSLPRPSWSWKRVVIGLNGQATKDQSVFISLIPPRANSLLAVLRIVLLCLFSLAMLGLRIQDRFKPRPLGGKDEEAFTEDESGGAPLGGEAAGENEASGGSGEFRGAKESRANFPPEASFREKGAFSGASLILSLLLFFLFHSLSPSAPLGARTEPEASGGSSAYADPESGAASPPWESSEPLNYPPPEILREFKERLEQPSPPVLFSLPEMELLSDEPGTLTLKFRVESRGYCFLPLPLLDAQLFRPREAKLASGEIVPVMADLEGEGLYLYLPPGISEVSYKGRFRDESSFQITFPETPRPLKIVNGLTDYQAEGLARENNLSGNSLFLTRIEDETPASGPGPEAGEGSLDGSNEGSPEDFPSGENPAAANDSSGGREVGESVVKPWFTVERVISLGLEQKVLTTVSSVAPLEAPYTLALDLVSGESPTSGTATAREGKVYLNFSAGREAVHWESSLKLPQDSALTLKAGEGPFSEVWILDAADLWRVEISGLAPVFSVSPAGFFNPQWRPWPNEEVSFKISRPQPVPGKYLVADNGTLKIQVGKESRLFVLSLRLRTSQGGNHSFRLPNGSEISDLRLNGAKLPFQPGSGTETQGPEVNVPLTPGDHQLELKWLDPRPLSPVTRAPEIDLKLSAANINIVMDTPADYWTLFVRGPRLGPAVLFWSFAAALLIFSFFLSSLRLAPLRTLSWFLFLLGLSQLSFFSTLAAAGWLLVLGLRERGSIVFKKPALFNLVQILLCVWTALALYFIYRGLVHGLLESPRMYVTGNGSYDHHLEWFQDKTDGPLARPWVLSIPNRVYQYVMLAWALWMAISIIRWLRWGWKSFSKGGIWKSSPRGPLPPAPGGPAPYPYGGVPQGGESGGAASLWYPPQPGDPSPTGSHGGYGENPYPPNYAHPEAYPPRAGEEGARPQAAETPAADPSGSAAALGSSPEDSEGEGGLPDGGNSPDDGGPPKGGNFPEGGGR